MSYNQLSQSDVETVVNELIDKNGSTTSLEVKEELRNRGFWATQAIVGVAMREIADSGSIPWDFNGRYRTYYKPGTQMSPTSASGLTPASASASTPVQVTVKPKRVPLDPGDREPIDSPAVGDWTVYDTKGNGVPLSFRGKLTEGQAKYAYILKTTGATFVDIRAERA
jgi:hypothetical protein